MRAVYSLDDLDSREKLDAGVDKPARLAVVGYPVAHSASPVMHQAALDAYQLNCRYIRLEVEPGEFPRALARMRALGFIGCNVTVPHKIAALDACDEVDVQARELGAVNTIRFEGDAAHGFNTDGPGFARAIEADFGTPLEKLSLALIGAGGGAGQAIATQRVLMGAGRLLLANRSLDKLEPLVTKLKSLAPESEILALALDDPSLAAEIHRCDLIVNTASVGLKADDPLIIPADCLLPTHRVYDTIYLPSVTPLLALANSLGCRNANGLSMLLHQGALAFQLWFPQTQPLPMMREALSAAAGSNR